ncbi:MAG TPA: hypothetical protein VNR51_09855, partial [Hyphomicrobium sp.]|nr:hypothetical protein [Hyphomicrobium sp.]
ERLIIPVLIILSTPILGSKIAENLAGARISPHVTAFCLDLSPGNHAVTQHTANAPARILREPCERIIHPEFEANR